MSLARCPGQDSRFLKPQDVAEVQCPECGQSVEFWPGDLMRKCAGCGHRFANPKGSLKCLEWCRYAAKCLATMRGESSMTITPLREELLERMKRTFGDDTERIERTLAVLELAEKIGRQVDADPLILVPAAILHDVGGAAAEILSDIGLPQAVEQEILDLTANHDDREKIDTPSGAALFDAILAAGERNDN